MSRGEGMIERIMGTRGKEQTEGEYEGNALSEFRK